MLKTEFRIDQNGRELTEHRTVTLPVACYKTTIVRNVHGHIPLHWHDELQFVLVVQGEALFHVNDQKIVVSQGDGLFINSGSMHMAEDKRKNDNCIYLCLNLSPYFVVPSELYVQYVHPYISATNLPYLLIKEELPWGAQILDAIRDIKKNLDEQPPLYEINVASHLLTMWKHLITSGYALEYDPSEVLKSRRMKDMVEWIHMHFADSIKLEDIARAGQLSRSETCRYFKQMLKTTPMQYVIDYRIRKSVELLQIPDYSITQIAYEVGFNSTSYFINQFRKSMQITPLKFRRELELRNKEGIRH
ncbi:AraC family transcriptional regulator [Paenibacillus sp. UMB7766-LJ446]|uniref:AraC family transcriptional regulator n=1 Tax=Paenibacillus sp. UMB7766-LJ446 TaxID=3046313 RepID=UPI0025504CFE|nr:AraC family transcriptional regulator [Paenibacillus sp. UMB7766-LJ446]MDK8192497.1 AraC family transcriptional regulator [Paenibacillus sp. UMB7766-LJ446]